MLPLTSIVGKNIYYGSQWDQKPSGPLNKVQKFELLQFVINVPIPKTTAEFLIYRYYFETS